LRVLWRLVLGILILATSALAVRAQTSEDEASHPEQTEADKLAQALANPVSNLWSLQFQFNNYNLTNDRWNYNLNFQRSCRSPSRKTGT
jgi:hypothetical protein